MTETTSNRSWIRALSLGLSLTLPALSLPTGGCGLETSDEELGFRSGDVHYAEVRSTQIDTVTPFAVQAELLEEMAEITPKYGLDGVISEDPTQIFEATQIAVQRANGDIMVMDRIGTRLQVTGAEDGIGVEWNADFTLLTFHTPRGSFALAAEGTLEQRRELAGMMIVLGTSGQRSAGVPLAALSAALWPAAAILGLIAAVYVVTCLVYTANCLDSAPQICAPNGVLSVDVTCGGVKTHFESEEGLPSGVGFELGTFNCEVHCQTGGGGGGSNDGPGDGPDIGGLVPEIVEEINPCPPGQYPVPCVSTTETFEVDNSGEIEEVTVTIEQETGYCCV